MAAWTGRATQVFVTCRTKARVDFPSEAQGWLLIHRCGLDNNQKAVVKAQTAGSHRAEDVGPALRSCFPSYSVRGKREHVYAVDDEEDFDTAESTVEALEDIEAFRAEGDISETEATTFEEEEVRDVLAVSWKDRRREIAAAKASRNFTRVRELQQSFRKEVDELKKRTKCHKCGRVGHWARDCRVRDRGGKGGKGERKGAQSSESQGSSSGAFACITMTERIEESRRTAAAEVFLTTAPGVGIVDSGCGKSVIGRRTLSRYLSALPEGQGSAKYQDDKHLFRCGNDTTEASKQSVQLPVGIGGRRGSLHVSVLDGKAEEAPLLVSKPALRSLGAVLDFENSVLQLKRIGTDVRLKEGPTGHYLLDLFQFPALLVSEGTENDAPEIFPDGPVEDSDTVDDSGNALIVTDTEAIQESPIREPLSTTPTLRCWTRVDDNCLTLRATRLDGPPWSSVRERETFDADTGETVETRRSIMDLTRRQRRAQIDRLRRLEIRLYCDPLAIADQKARQSQESELVSRDTQESCVVMSRRLNCRIKRQCSEAFLSGQAKQTTIAELFSPPGVVLEAVRRGGVSHGSYDLTTGYDMQVPSVRQKVRTRLERDRPDVLIASPPYSEMGTWNRDNWSKVDDWRRKFVLLWSFTCLCMQDQLARGGIVFLEHPWASWTWRLPSTKQLLKSCMRVRGDTRVLGRMNERPMKEMTGWLTNSDELARALLRLRPGKHDDELMDDVLSAIDLERNQEVSLEDVYALEETGNEAEPENVSEDGSDDDDTEKKANSDE